MALLAKYATFANKTRGRKFACEPSHTRSQFQRDRDRIIHSTAFRRLQHKTQVFLHHEGKHYRTRLTHTLEVSQIARSIARALRLDEDLAEAIALAHDLGHPPFGHAGEYILNEKMAQWGGFEHNLQSLRTVTKLENHYAEHDGLNLTWECLEGILKHNGPIISDKSEVINSIKYLEPHTHAGLEAQIAAIADDIAYNSHDIDDAIRGGIINIEDLTQIEILAPIIKEIAKKYPDLPKKRAAHEVQRRLITLTIEDVIKTSLENIAKLNPKNVDDVRLAPNNLVSFSDELAIMEKQLKKFMRENVYHSQKVLKHVKIAQKIVAKLFDELLKQPRLPIEWQKRMAKKQNEKQRARVICDYIAGMTDPYAIELYQQIFDERVNLS